MARTIRNGKLDTRSARSRLTLRREPYWTVISEGCALGYRRGATGSTWIGRFRDDTGRQHYEALGAADDARDPDGLSVFSFAQAQAKSRAFFARKAREVAGDWTSTEGPYRVTDALDDYFKNYAKRGKAVSAALSAANLHIRPTVPTANPKQLTDARESVDSWFDERSLQADLVRLDRFVPVPGVVGGRNPCSPASA